MEEIVWRSSFSKYGIALHCLQVNNKHVIYPLLSGPWYVHKACLAGTTFRMNERSFQRERQSGFGMNGYQPVSD
jgi:hypothetical protein